MKHLLRYNQLFENLEVTRLYRLIGGGQFGGPPVTEDTEPIIGNSVTQVFATPKISAINYMIEFSLEQGENELTGDPIQPKDMRVLEISSTSARAPFPHEKFMHWDDSDEGEVFIPTGEIINVYTLDQWHNEHN